MDSLLARMEEVDLVLVEGFKSYSHRKLEVFRPSVGKPMIAMDDETIVAVASDEKFDAPGVPLLNLNDINEIACFIVGFCDLEIRSADGAA